MKMLKSVIFVKKNFKINMWKIKNIENLEIIVTESAKFYDVCKEKF